MRLTGEIRDLQYETIGSAGVDLRAREDIIIPVSPLLFHVSTALHFLKTAASLEEWQTVYNSWLQLGGNDSAPNVKVVSTGVYIGEAKDLEHIWITPRSGLAAKHGVTVLNTPGLVDGDYPGEIGVIMINHGFEKFEIKKGDRIAQMVLAEHKRFENINIPNTIRHGGMGSTGVK